MTTDGEVAALGIDIGGTKMLALAVTRDGGIVQRERLTTPRSDPRALVDSIAKTAADLAPGRPVGLGVAGIVSRDGMLRFGANVDLHDVHVRDLVADAVGTRVAVSNDATVALYGELRAGIARACLDVVMLTLGTGVGGAVVAEGELVLGANGIAGELGHIPLVDGGRSCPCGNDGCLEAYASGSAIGLRAEELLDAAQEPSSMRDLDAVDGKAVTLAALDGDELAQRILDEAGYWLGVGVLALVNVFDPELVVIGGGAATLAGPIMVPIATRVISDRILGAGHRPPPPIALAHLGDDAGAVGAALYAYDTARDAGDLGTADLGSGE